jgi:hypothetical protein
MLGDGRNGARSTSVGENMNTRILAAAAGAALLAVTGCSAPMSAKESCKQYKELTASFAAPEVAVSMDRTKITGQFTDLASKAPESLKPDMTLVAEWLKVSLIDRDNDKSDRLLAEYQKAERRVRDICGKVA